MIITVGVVWFTDSRGTMGIVLTYDKQRVERIKYRSTIGICRDNEEQEQSIKHIIDYGGKFPLDDVWLLIKDHGMIFDPDLFEKFPNN